LVRVSLVFSIANNPEVRKIKKIKIGRDFTFMICLVSVFGHKNG